MGMSKQMNRTDALKMDRGVGFYAEADDEFGWGVFGSQSGFCYHLGCKAEAEQVAAEMERSYVTV